MSGSSNFTFLFRFSLDIFLLFLLSYFIKDLVVVSLLVKTNFMSIILTLVLNRPYFKDKDNL